MPTPPDLELVAAAIRSRRNQLGLTQQDLASRAGVAVGTIATLESAERWPWARNRTSIEAALGWQAGSMTEISRGGYPLPVEETGAEPPRYLDPVDQHIADTPGLAPEDAEALIAIARRLRAARTSQTGT
jgi:transcriptional regulator with XRE-family HTH domain